MTGPGNALDTFSSQSQIVVTKQGTTCTIQVEGKWDEQVQARMSQAVAQALVVPPESVVLDLSRATSMDSGGIALVVGLAKRCTCQNVRLVIVSGPAEVQRLFQTFTTLPFVGGP